MNAMAQFSKIANVMATAREHAFLQHEINSI